MTFYDLVSLRMSNLFVKLRRIPIPQPTRVNPINLEALLKSGALSIPASKKQTPKTNEAIVNIFRLNFLTGFLSMIVKRKKAKK
jgi:hypothetical protein